MAITLTNGLKKPETGDKGASLFTDLEANITQLDAHNHNGSNSAKIPSSSVTKLSQNILAANWADPVNGTYKQTITTVGAVDVDLFGIQFVDSSGRRYHLETERISATQYYVYSNDNTLEVLALYM